ncbi:MULTISPECIES: response regulator transcription factor [Rhizobium]|uniref:DNA-binding response regulator n=1 Tax=Rhizobium tropici TaxID=398 RepID=A0A329Y8Y8_RHITR|nr:MULTISPECIES: response regulator transcription factor [Rhizobium]MBB3289879.1 two-component system OmpR family response regulator [Rhizobium sp. BK252]MBB3404108.1 two-component system OmpR family response regulator [Rhizobium sp. BK289]MBB3417207.1 two-component system OmpR family response regulator [Rhizobium sp. BK284]MBB3485084.1 two-component system OmpR family response regulator [Rhizobium sp. BK347]MDK4722705.1 response regulator transcription factor [Rhizobium sp. CNPSo 3968]
MRILLVEDDDTIGSAVRDHIAAGPHAVDWVRNLTDADEVTSAVQYGLVLLDLQLPDGSGIDFLKRLRRRPDETPVIILTARDQISDRIEGLNSGADDYLVKPFNLGELTARILAVARRYTGSPQPTIRFADLEIDQPQRRVRLEGKDVVLTGREWAVLDLLVARPGAIVSKDKIEEALYAFGSEIESNTVEVYISRLRKKIGRDRIRTARGVGYCLGER